MNTKRLLLAIIAVFAGVWVTDFVIHGVLLQETYKQTMSLWRPEAEMKAHMKWLMLGQFLAAATFTMIYARGFAEVAHLRCGIMYGLFMGLFSQATTFITFAVQPFPSYLAVRWVIAGVVQGVLLGMLVYFVYRPAAKTAVTLAATSNPAA